MTVHYTPTWTYCSDELPPERGYYLVSYKSRATGKTFVREAFFAGGESNRMIVWRTNEDIQLSSPVVKVYAWRTMLLPAPLPD